MFPSFEEHVLFRLLSSISVNFKIVYVKYNIDKCLMADRFLIELKCLWTTAKEKREEKRKEEKND